MPKKLASSAVVLGRRPDQHLDHEQGGHHEEEPGAGTLGGVRATSPGARKVSLALLAPAPAEDVPAPEGGEQQPDPAE